MIPVTHLSPDEAADVAALVAAADRHDGIAPLNEDALLSLTAPAGERHLLHRSADGALVGYAVADRHGHGQAVVAPAARGHGLGRALVSSLPEVDAWWSFGDLPAARALATGLGLSPIRELLIMSRDLDAHPVPSPEPNPHNVSQTASRVSQRPSTTIRDTPWVLRPFVDDDLDALLAVNAAAFAHHPEQGSLDRDAFALRAAAGWFHREDLIVAELDGELVGFHWTKRHGDGVGEVYVLAVAPAHEGKGLGRRLLRAGLTHLADRGCREVILYVDGAEEGPVHLYESDSFGVRRRDVAWAQTGEGR